MNIIIDLLLRIVAAILVVIIHELPKIPVVYAMTHPIHRSGLKKTLKPLSIIDPIGIIMFLYAGVGWQKPLDFNPAKFRQKERGILAVVLIGFIASSIGLLFFVLNYSLLDNAYLKTLMVYGLYDSFVIIVINLLPIPPLDMTKLVFVASTEGYYKLVRRELILHMVFILLIIFKILPMAIHQLFLMGFSAIL